MFPPFLATLRPTSPSFSSLFCGFSRATLNFRCLTLGVGCLRFPNPPFCAFCAFLRPISFPASSVYSAFHPPLSRSSIFPLSSPPCSQPLPLFLPCFVSFRGQPFPASPSQLPLREQQKKRGGFLLRAAQKLIHTVHMDSLCPTPLAILHADSGDNLEATRPKPPERGVTVVCPSPLSVSASSPSSRPSPPILTPTSAGPLPAFTPAGRGSSG